MNIDPPKWIEVNFEFMKSSVGDSHQKSMFLIKPEKLTEDILKSPSYENLKTIKHRLCE